MRSLAVVVLSVCLLAASGLRRVESVRDRMRDRSAQLTAASSMPATVATRRSTAPKPDLPQLAFVLVERLELATPAPHTLVRAHQPPSSPPRPHVVPRSSRGPPG